MADQPNFGPYSKWPAVAAFSALSERSFCLFDRAIEVNSSKLKRPLDHLVVRMAYQAKTTSMAIRINNSWALVLPALSLARIRLEQSIVCSFLLHEDPNKGLYPFLKFIPIGEHRWAKEALSDASLAANLQINLSKTEADAIAAQSELTPGFTLEDGKFQRSWTPLDLRSMAVRRDKLVKEQSGRILKQPLETDYISIYRASSAVVHADCASLSYRYLDLFAAPSGKPVLMPLPSWAIMTASVTSHYDILQCYEMLRWFEFPEADEYRDVQSEWQKAVDDHIR